MALNKSALGMVLRKPLGTGLTHWTEYTGLDNFPHNDFCYNLGIYGVPAGMFLLLVWMVLGAKIRTLPSSKEKILARSLLIFYLIIGLKGMYTPTKLYWLIFAFIAVIVESKNWVNYFSGDQQFADEEIYLSSPMGTNA